MLPGIGHLPMSNNGINKNACFISVIQIFFLGPVALQNENAYILTVYLIKN